ncbi:MAG: DsrE/DsrF/DrsH-like family protein [Thermodesulfobacteriota bacterium]|nr:DsrE/DsrF/DrsH-like family protein [Thermodesulfobacteriota bacterium]
MDVILICRDALENSLLGNLAMAMEVKKNGTDAGVVFTQEALAALAGEPFRWSPLLENRPTKMKVSKNATAMGIQMTSEKDKRWTDTGRLIKFAKDAGVQLMACPMWAKLLDVEDKLPPEVTVLDSQEMLKKMNEAKTIIGGF